MTLLLKNTFQKPTTKKNQVTKIKLLNLIQFALKISDELQAAAAPKQSPAQSSPAPQSHSSNFPTSYSFNLPPCDTEVFSGDYMTWPTFRDMFTAMYIDNSRLSPVEKLFHLVQKTEGEAKEIVQKSPLTNSGFSQAWSNHSDRYENKRVLVNGQLKVLFNLPIVHSESSQGLKRLQRDINSCISVLKTYDIDVESWDPIFVYLCSNRLPDSTLTLWEHTLSDKSSIPRWAELDTFLTNRFRTLESVSEMRRGVPGSSHKESSSDGKSKPSKIFNSFQSKVSDPKCPLCPNEVHIIRKCPNFLRMNPEARSSEIKRQGLCFNCFSKTHSLKNCPSKHNCYTCNKRHNTLLHKSLFNFASSVPSTVSDIASNLNPNSASFSHSAIQSTSSGAGNVQNYFSSNIQGVLLGTAMVQIVHKGVTYSVRGLFDSGSEGTFITERLFNKLKLPYKRTNAQISGLNNSNSASVLHPDDFKSSVPDVEVHDFQLAKLGVNSAPYLTRWEKPKAIQRTFGSRWQNENSEPHVSVDSVVAVTDDNLPSNVWRLGRISKVYMGSDGRVRVVDVVTQREL
ncbi:uncharacterized protein [Musca autumnalis]|uniref:uncharacterized protein n=1 Tax=Musca autumnalis TaxID=221902 RepID=UPI003CF1B5D2